jgi:hypothetical protein
MLKEYCAFGPMYAFLSKPAKRGEIATATCMNQRLPQPPITSALNYPMIDTSSIE